jgi:hypothetical protein
MKTLISSLFLLIGISAFAQLPNKFNYQGIVRNSSGVAVSNQAVQIKISILDATATGSLLYQERHSVTTNQFGLYNVAIGGGTILSGSFNSINWGFQDKYIKTELSTNNGITFSTLGTSQLLAVPYAMYAGTANNPGPQGPAGPQGPQGATGPAGPQGPQGISGSNGNTILSGTTTPLSTQGNNGDYYLNTTTNILYGPKTSSGWGSGTILTGQGPTGPQGPAGPMGATGPQGPAGAVGATGPQGPTGATGLTGATGPQGPAGTNGNTILNGTTVPTSTQGNNGDFYINTTTNIIYGPKTASGWGSGSTLSSSAGGGSLTNSNFQVFDATGIFTVPAGITKIMVECWGAGGGGSNYTYWQGSGNITDNLGGGGGGYGKSIFTVTPGTNYLVTVGLGGAFNNAGGNSSFGSLIISNGGASLYSAGGGPPPMSFFSAGGTSNGQINIQGGAGYVYASVSPTATTGISGGSPMGGMGVKTGPGKAPGGGGAGDGSAGANGRVIVWW